MANYWSNDDGLVVSFGIKDRIKKGRIASMGGDIQTLTLDVVGTELGDTASTAHLEGAASIPAGAHIIGATFHVTTPFAGSSAELDLGLYNALTQAAVDAVGIDDAIAVTAIDAIGDTIACDGNDIDTIVGAAPVAVAASYDAAAFTAGVGKLIVEYYQP